MNPKSRRYITAVKRCPIKCNMKIDKQTDTFINAVKNRPFLYDSSYLNYKNEKFKKMVWDEIGENLNTDGDTALSYWLHLVSGYIKYLRSNITCQDEAHREEYKHWKWAEDFISFLPPQVAFNSGMDESHEAGPSRAALDFNDFYFENYEHMVSLMPPDTQRTMRLHIINIITKQWNTNM